MFRPIFWLELSTDILCLASQDLRCCVLTRFIKRYLLIRISNLIPHSLNLQCKLNGIRSLRNKIFWSAVFNVMHLNIFKHILLSLNTCNHFKVVKCLQMTKTKHLRKVKQNWKRLFSAFFLGLFRKGLPLDKKRMRAHEIMQIVQTRKMNDEHIYVTMGFKWFVSAVCWFWIIQESVTGSVGNSVKNIWISILVILYGILKEQKSLKLQNGLFLIVSTQFVML